MTQKIDEKSTKFKYIYNFNILGKTHFFLIPPSSQKLPLVECFRCNQFVRNLDVQLLEQSFPPPHPSPGLFRGGGGDHFERISAWNQRDQNLHQPSGRGVEAVGEEQPWHPTTPPPSRWRSAGGQPAARASCPARRWPAVGPADPAPCAWPCATGLPYR